ncbi:Uncharacterised protein (plasmid) [Legionella adelaidensis]|uniref:Tfp pilus assembly protein PilV n=1 Tax=Legionella adelaidensis TaxID=45056 RepID=A0A0W0R1H3_9GAMM|nr:hypothetical protein [Legionella adelaidensis]KTC64934.1 hypothetical protein Lade_1741 [Legionella adelaidensis]VEH85617.1 Uncharacterised protein [Legionella adelaidensis]
MEGFSIYEVLIILMLGTSSSLFLMNNQWKSLIFFKEEQIKATKISEINSLSEKLTVQGSWSLPAEEMFGFTIFSMMQGEQVELCWKSSRLNLIPLKRVVFCEKQGI